MLGSKYPKAE